ncbi:unnamed protein product [Sphagnum tenellum]
MCNAEDWEIDRGASENVIFCFMNQQDEHSKPACPRVNDKGQKNQVSVKVTPRNTSAMQTSPPLSVRPFITAWPAPSTPESGGTKLIPLIQAIELPPLAGPPIVMNVIVVAAEYAPWSKTGALGDVVGSLPKALSCHSHNITVVAPQYTNYADAWETGIWKIYNVSGQDMEVGYFHTFEDGVDFVFINSSIFHAVASNIYGGSHELPTEPLLLTMLYMKL